MRKFIVLVGIGACQGPGQQVDDKLQEFLDAKGLEPKDCGTIQPGCSNDDSVAQCFADAWDACDTAQVEIVKTTIEGDPITETLVVWDNGGTCTIERFYDDSEDLFGGSKDVTQSGCTNLVFEAEPMGCDTLYADACIER
jgi:hypothetical protein